MLYTHQTASWLISLSANLTWQKHDGKNFPLNAEECKDTELDVYKVVYMANHC